MSEELRRVLTEALNDEYKARATYQLVTRTFGEIRPFINIVEAENRHIQALINGGVTLGDLGYRGPECATDLSEEANMLLITRDRAPAHRFLLSQVRQQVETPFSQLRRKFVDRVCSRSWTGLWNTLQLKVLYYNLRHAGVLSG